MKKTIDNIELKNMIISGAALLQQNKDHIDSMNVFPVPDGDTGTNMNLTIQSVLKEINVSGDSIKEITDAIALGSLKGARGNSGVILSQILKGFSKTIGKNNEINAKVIEDAIVAASESAFKAVMKPKEGTILTVCRELGVAATEKAKHTDDIIELLEYVIQQGQIMLDKTPDMLPVLKEAGVVDAGGMGLIVIFSGMLAYLKGEKVDEKFALMFSSIKPDISFDFGEEHLHSKFSYCTEFLINGVDDSTAEDIGKKLTAALDCVGDCVLVVGQGDILKVHVHTDNPDIALQHALNVGYLSDLKIDNMNLQKKKKKKESSPRKKVALVAVSVGDGMNKVFKELNIDVLIEGGQSLNPSIEDVLTAVDSVRSENVIVLPNNKNIIMACEQAAKVSNKNVLILQSKSIPQGISAAIAFSQDLTVDENFANMKSAIEEVHCIQITNAVRTTKLNDIDINEGDVISLIDGNIVCDGKDIPSVILSTFEKSDLDINDCVVTLFYGEGISEEQANQQAKDIEAKYPESEVYVQHGGQPLYPYIISVE